MSSNAVWDPIQYHRYGDLRLRPALELFNRPFRKLEREMKHRALANTVAPAWRYLPGRDGLRDGYRFDIDPDFSEIHAKIARHRSALRRAKRATLGSPL